MGFDALQVQLDETHTRDLFGQDRALNIGNTGLLEMKLCWRFRLRPKG
jgi:hypothetical protein